MHLSAEFWISSCQQPDEVLMDTDAIASFVRDAFEKDPNMVDLASFPESMKRDEVLALIQSMSQPDAGQLRFHDGGAVLPGHFDRYLQNCNLEQVPEKTTVRHGMVIERADMRTWPTIDTVFRSPETIELDRFQENGLFPGDWVAVLHESADGQWYFAQSYNYAAWVPREKVAIGERGQVKAFGQSRPFLVVAGDRVAARRFQGSTEISGVQLEMGTRLPLVSADSNGYLVNLPIRTSDGRLDLGTGLLAPGEDVLEGYLPYTRRNIIQQAFKFLGEPYGWGHSSNARDCTGLVLEVFKTFGFALPRNSGQQGHSDIGQNQYFSDDASEQEKLEKLEGASVGDLLYSPGHVMLYLGRFEGAHYVIHDVSGSRMPDEKGRVPDQVFRGVSVTPLMGVHSSTGENYFEELYAIKRLR